MTATHAPVSVIMPILNEEPYLAEAVASVLAQDYPGELEVVLAVGPSTDRTEQIAAELAEHDARVVVVTNHTGRTPDGLNAAISASRHDYVIRMDGHGRMSPGYLATAVAVLEQTGAANVGGVMLAQGRTAFERAVAVAMGSRLGLGGGRFHTGGTAGEVDTVFLGAFRRSWLEKVGGYDSAFTRAQDWELNYRIRQARGLIWFTPELHVSYRPRPSLGKLARQYFRTGAGRRQVIEKYPSTANPRYLAPPIAVLAIAAGAIGGSVRPALWAVPVGYAAAVTLGGLALGAAHGSAVAVRVPAVLATMHLSWGAGFLFGSGRRHAGNATTATTRPARGSDQ